MTRYERILAALRRDRHAVSKVRRIRDRSVTLRRTVARDWTSRAALRLSDVTRACDHWLDDAYPGRKLGYHSGT